MKNITKFSLNYNYILYIIVGIGTGIFIWFITNIIRNSLI